jgi:intracellular septation protein A
LSRIVGIAKFIVSEFGPLAVFWILSLTAGIKPAIAGSILVIVVDSLWRWRRGIAFTRLYKLTSALTLVFGAVDLMSATPFLLKYEAVVTNLATCGAFVVGAFGAKPLIQEVAEQRQGAPFPGGEEIRRFFQIFTLFWAAYFLLKAMFYFWLAWTLPMAEAMAWRSVLGGASLGLMIAFSATQGRRMFLLLRRLGWLPPPASAPA